jgi:hypothetical protein
LKITDGQRESTVPDRSLRITTVADLDKALGAALAFPEIIELQIGGQSLAGEDLNQQIALLFKQLPLLESLTMTEATPASRLGLVSDLPMLRRLSIVGKSPDLEEQIEPALSNRLRKLSPTLRSISVSSADIHPSLFRALASNTSLERLTVGEVDDDASVLAGLTIDDFRPLKERKLLTLYVNCERRDWTKKDTKELDDLHYLFFERGKHVDLIRRQRRTGSSEAESSSPDVVVVADMNQAEFADFIARRDEVALRVFNLPTRHLTPRRHTHLPSIGIQLPDKVVVLPRQSVEARKVTGDDAKQIASALPHFPEISALSLSMKSRSKCPMEVFRQATFLPDLRWLFVRSTGTWPAEALRLASKHSRLERLTRVALDDTPEIQQAFAELVKLRHLERLDFVATSPTCFETLAQLPNLNVCHMTLSKEGSQEPITEETRAAIAKLNGREMTIGIEGYCHPTLVRAMWSVESMRSLTFMAHARGATVDDFRGVDKLNRLEYLTLNPMSVDEQTRNAVSLIQADKKKRLQARTARERRKQRSRQLYKEGLLQEPPKITRKQIDMWIADMATKGRQFSPAPLLAAGDEALEAMLRRILPEGFQATPQLSQDAVNRFIEELGADAFLIRDHATKQLAEDGSSWQKVLEAKIDGATPEVRRRIQGILSSWRPPKEACNNYRFDQAWNQYVSGLSEFSSDELLSDVCAQALHQALHESDRREIIRFSLHALAKSEEPEIHGRFAKLCELEDPAPAIFAIECLGGRILTPLNRAALASDNWRLRRSALMHTPSSRLDPPLRAQVHETVSTIFAPDATPEVVGADDRERDILAAIFKELPAARRHLLTNAKSDDPDRASLAIVFLSDSQFFRQPLPQDVEVVLRQASESKYQQVRLATAESTRIYKLGEASLPILLHLLDDPSDEVWHAATNGLLQQQAWVKQGESKLELIEALKSRSSQVANEKLQSRHENVRKILERRAEFDWVEWPD